VRAFWDRPLGSKLILVLAIVYLALSILWQRPCQLHGQGTPVCGYRTEWHGIGRLGGLLAVAIIVWELLPILWPRLSMRGWTTAVVTAALGVALTVATIATMIDDNVALTGYAWLGFGVSIAIALVAILRVRFRWMTRRHDELEAKLAAASQPPDPSP
jgi:hypothetical protein